MKHCFLSQCRTLSIFIIAQLQGAELYDKVIIFSDCSVVKRDYGQIIHQISSKGPVSIDECAADGSYVRLNNDGRRVCSLPNILRQHCKVERHTDLRHQHCSTQRHTQICDVNTVVHRDTQICDVNTVVHRETHRFVTSTL